MSARRRATVTHGAKATSTGASKKKPAGAKVSRFTKRQWEDIRMMAEKIWDDEEGVIAGTDQAQSTARSWDL